MAKKIELGDVKDKAKEIYSKSRVDFETQVDNMKTSGVSLVITVVATFIIMIGTCLAVFFTSLQGAEKVMVPNVMGKNLTTALLELQQKELYPKIQLKYSDEPGDEGKILDQNPEAGAIVKAYRRITLTVSRGIILEELESYVGMNINEVYRRLDAMYAGETQMVTVAKIVNKPDASKEGTVLAQFPQEGEPVVDSVGLVLVVSKGDNVNFAEVPKLSGKNITQIQEIINSTNLIFNFKQQQGKYDKVQVLEQSKAGTKEVEYSNIEVELGLPQTEKDSTSYGIFSAELESYPFPVPVKVTARTPDGKTKTLVEIVHPGKSFTIPYAEKKGTVLTLYVMDEEENSITIE